MLDADTRDKVIGALGELALVGDLLLNGFTGEYGQDVMDAVNELREALGLQEG